MILLYYKPFSICVVDTPEVMAASFLKGFSVIILILVAVFPPKLCCLEIDVDPRNYGQNTMQPVHSSKTGNYVIRCITHYFEFKV